GAFTFNEDF
nr:Chain B, 9-per peptide from Ribonucleoside-diphosphate reductase small chain 1 [synthetic construct]